jgi:hypothetical protein
VCQLSIREDLGEGRTEDMVVVTEERAGHDGG